MSLYAELKRRHVFRVALFYVVAAWLVVQVAETVLPLFEVPDGVLRGLVVLLAIGFVPVVIFSWVYELTPEGLKRDSEVTESEAAAAGTSRKLNVATLVVAVLAIGMLVADRLVPEKPAVAPATESPPGQAESSGEVAAPKAASIAVLPFADLSPDGDQEYFSDGMAEEILNALVKVDGLDVASRTSSFGFKGQESLGIRVIADRLGVRHVLEGSVRRSGNAIRITAQLIDADVDRHLWSETYDRPLTAESLFAIQEEIATSIVAALVESLGIEVGEAVALSKPTANLTAYDLYLQARALFQARIDMDVADGLAVRALEQDPEFAKAWELRAALHALMDEYGYSDLPQEEIDRLSIEYAQRALAIDPESGMALATMAHVRYGAASRLRERHELAAIIRDLEEAVEIEPNNTSALNWLALAQVQVGRMDESLATFRRCMDVDPLFGPCAENEYEILWVMGRPEEAWESFQRSMRRGAVTQNYANFAMLAHFEQESLFMFVANQSDWLPGWQRHDELYAAYLDLGADHTQLAEEILRFADLSGKSSAGYLENLLIPLGAYDLSPFPMLIWGPDYAGYRRSPQFDRFIRQSGVLDYWLAHGFPSWCRPAGDDGFECD